MLNVKGGLGKTCETDRPVVRQGAQAFSSVFSGCWNAREDGDEANHERCYNAAGARLRHTSVTKPNKKTERKLEHKE